MELGFLYSVTTGGDFLIQVETVGSIASHVERHPRYQIAEVAELPRRLGAHTMNTTWKSLFIIMTVHCQRRNS
jgi:hypothetical protein